MLYSFHPGTMGGPALADILFGKVVPSGKTPVTFPKMVGQLPIYYAHNHTGRAPSGKETLIDDIPLEAGQTSLGCSSFYMDAGFGPLFPFGYGLSYTTFAYDKLHLSADTLRMNEILTITANLTNTGKYAGTEVVQLYVRDKVIPQLIASSAEKAEVILSLFIEKGYREADINLGCPFPLLARRHNGSGILPYPEEVKALLSIVTRYPQISFSVKMRLGWEQPDECLALAPILNDLPLRQITMHPRLGKQGYKGAL